MDRDRPFKAAPPVWGEPDAAAKRRRRRAVMNDTRRKVERALRVAEAEPIGLDSMDLGTLRLALAKYRDVRQ